MSGGASDAISAEIVAEARRLLEAARERGVSVRLIGGIAIQLHGSSALPAALQRAPKDIDLVTIKAEGRAVRELVAAMGYEPNDHFNNMNAGRRALFYDVAHERQLDVFIGRFEMCHLIPIAERLTLEPATVPLAELLLTKLQIFHLNEKDQRDILALMYEHEVADDDADTVNAALIARLCAEDWGLWRTLKLNLERSRTAVDGYGLPPAGRVAILRRLDALWDRVQAEPKGARWRMRDRLGDRKRWYEEPDEVT